MRVRRATGDEGERERERERQTVSLVFCIARVEGERKGYDREKRKEKGENEAHLVAPQLRPRVILDLIVCPQPLYEFLIVQERLNVRPEGKVLETNRPAEVLEERDGEG